MREQNPDWLYHTDIGDGPDSPPIALTVRGVEEVECGGKMRVGLRFSYIPRGRGARDWKLLVLNATNLNTMASEYGRDTTAWVGQRVTLYTVPDDGHGFGPGIRIRSGQGERA